MLVFGSLGPGGHQVGELQLTDRFSVSDDPAVGSTLAHQALLALTTVLADVVEKQVHHRPGSFCGPPPGGGVESYLDVATVDDLTT